MKNSKHNYPILWPQGFDWINWYYIQFLLLLNINEADPKLHRISATTMNENVSTFDPPIYNEISGSKVVAFFGGYTT
ncbi:hypothetical protein PB1_10399 [Bacillus methanolicus PB1]|uniref:Uncharacterized protein n=1 Tax=Bacillus methanolicus PB1 TaxID=997296 RepID=I3DUQ3_BACMT|nr:hypothetical protein PB1_10399 [Bacillus methanolicus PB1]